MKKRKRNFLQKMLAVLLSAVLTAGMITTTMPAEVNAAARVSRASLPAAKEGHTHKVCVAPPAQTIVTAISPLMHGQTRFHFRTLEITIWIRT